MLAASARRRIVVICAIRRSYRVTRPNLPACQQAICAFFCVVHFAASNGPIRDAMPRNGGLVGQEYFFFVERSYLPACEVLFKVR
jgi:hypothetical protein